MTDHIEIALGIAKSEVEYAIRECHAEEELDSLHTKLDDIRKAYEELDGLLAKLDGVRKARK